MSFLRFCLAKGPQFALLRSCWRFFSDIKIQEMREHKLCTELRWTSPAVGCGGCLWQGKMSHCKFERESSIVTNVPCLPSAPVELDRAPPWQPSVCALYCLPLMPTIKLELLREYRHQLSAHDIHGLGHIAAITDREAFCCRPSTWFLGIPSQEAMQTRYGKGQVFPS